MLTEAERAYLRALLTRERNRWQDKLDWSESHSAILSRDRAIKNIASINVIEAKLTEEP